MPLRTRDFDYHLPDELIAARPLAERAASRMLVVHRDCGRIEHRMFRDFPEFLRPDDLLVLNDTKVIPARVFSDDGGIELLCLDRLSPLEWRCLVRPGKRMKPGRTVTVAGITGTVMEVFDNGDRLIRWDAPVDLNEHGHLALPHYMGRDDEAADRERYQTVFAREEGAIAAPTAGLHFTPEMLEQLPHAFLTLHVGVGTFRPVKRGGGFRPHHAFGKIRGERGNRAPGERRRPRGGGGHDGDAGAGSASDRRLRIVDSGSKKWITRARRTSSSIRRMTSGWSAAC